MKTNKKTQPVHINVATYRRIVKYANRTPSGTIGEAVEHLVAYALARKAALAKNAAKSKVRR